MLTLIIPCAGRSFIFSKPRWTLQCSEGDILLTKCLKTINLDIYDRIVVSILKEDFIYIPKSVLIGKLSKKVEICELNDVTSGPAETIYQTIIAKNINGAIHIKDIDVLFPTPCSEEKNFVSGIHLLNYESDFKNVKNKSFITRNEKNIVMDIIEKNIKSDIISIGLYGIKSSNDFLSVYEKLRSDLESNECIFVSHIIAYLIGVEKKIFEFIEIPKYELFETEKDYDKYLRCTGTYFIDTLSLDIKKHIDELILFSRVGCELVFLVCKDSYEEIKGLCDNLCLRAQFVICNSSEIRKFISNENDLKDVYSNVL